MKHVSLLLIAAISTVSATIEDTDKLGYVFEITRHGARAPLNTVNHTYFKVGTGMLTGSGMRQRALLGRFNRDRYVHYYKLLDEVYNPNQVYVQSTDIPRTL